MLASLKNYENYLYRNEDFSERILRPHFNFIQIMKGLIQKMNNPHHEEGARSWLIDQLDKREKIVCRNWLTEFSNNTT